MIQPQSTLFRRREGGVGDDGALDSPSSAPAPYQTRPGTAAAASVHTNALQEQENDALMQALLSDMRRAKKSFTKMGEEVREQNAVLERLRTSFLNAQNSLRKTMRNLDKIGWGSFKHMWVLALFVIVFFMLLYLMLRFW
ncbi:putative Qc-SNARE protein [Leishmania major strain Friedlin]|uniref:Putative Qc-SNARE protein n=1 Tax=Leishmania major TaxID=5664 RepID=E9ADR5_LEIMA|nr:putative Qc-SNARE protein [Leishmania major strain Friedlin]CAG9577792.1 Qc-SNARE_protein_-_putative [Leishmania major strain Friedlin]CBZ12394.1 putative Qc-SNARE protein [Leishmania major strain Friedlin]|eukprot:XP_003722137.1 putative Qc-SNARE protein [Leishmania major strain Friedlin]